MGDKLTIVLIRSMTAKSVVLVSINNSFSLMENGEGEGTGFLTI